MTEVVFGSKYKNYRLYIKQRKKFYDSFGNEQYTDEVVAQFDNGRFVTSDKEIIDFMVNYKAFGVDYWVISGLEKSGITKEGERMLKEVERTKDTFTCPHCETTAKTLAGLKAHIRIKHPEKLEEDNVSVS